MSLLVFRHLDLLLTSLMTPGKLLNLSHPQFWQRHRKWRYLCSKTLTWSKEVNASAVGATWQLLERSLTNYIVDRRKHVGGWSSGTWVSGEIAHQLHKHLCVLIHACHCTKCCKRGLFKTEMTPKLPLSSLYPEAHSKTLVGIYSFQKCQIL